MNDTGLAVLEAMNPGLDQDELNDELNSDAINRLDVGPWNPSRDEPLEYWTNVVVDNIDDQMTPERWTSAADGKRRPVFSVPAQYVTAAAVLVVAYALIGLTDEIRKVAQEIHELTEEVGSVPGRLP